MLALSEARPELNRRVEGTAQNEPVQLASLALPVVELKPDAEPVKIPDFTELVAKMQAQIPLTERPQRRVFSLDSTLETRNSEPETYTNLYLAMVAEKELLPDASRLTPSYENRLSELLPTACCLPPSADFDPIYTYDLNGNRTSMIDPTGITNYTYDALNRLTSITNNKGFVTSFTYDALGRRTSMTHGNGVQTTYTYDAASQLLSLVHQLGAATINSFSYTYDGVGNRKTKVVNGTQTFSYTYDTLNRLVQAMNPLPSNPLETYQYDAVGNRSDSNQNGLSRFNAANQLEEDGTFRYSYDRNGNQIQKVNKTTGEFTQFEYDAENKLVRVVSPDTTVNYKYDGLGRRVEKEVTQAGLTKTTRFIYDNEDILLELDGSNNIVARYTHGPGIDEPLVMEKGGASFFYHADGLGSITEITDSLGALKQRYTYSSFGKIESQLDPNFVQPYTFTAREFDPETGLYFYRKRVLDPLTGRFNQEDPVGIVPFGAGSLIHLYSYAGNNPVNLVDPSGAVFNLATAALGAGIGATVGAISTVISNPNYTLADIGAAALSGAALGATAGFSLGTSLLLNTAAGAVTGVTADLTGQVLSNLARGRPALENINTDSLVIAGIAGAGAGYLGALGLQFGATARDALMNGSGVAGGVDIALRIRLRGAHGAERATGLVCSQ